MTDSGIRAEPLGGGRRILVSETHRFGTDAFLLASFAQPRRSERAADLGTGCGIIPTLWLGTGATAGCVGFELSEEACALARETAALNGDSERFSVLHIDLRTLTRAGNTSGVSVERESFGLVACNPPYFAERSGYISPDPQRAQARSELTCSVTDVCEAAAYLLRYGGRLCLCHRPERLTDVLCAMRGCGIEPKRLRMVQQSPEKAPWLVLVEGRRGGKSGLDLLPPMYMLGADGKPSAELEDIYAQYRENRGFSDEAKKFNGTEHGEA